MSKVPNGFSPIAVRDDRMGTCVVSFNHNTKEFFFIVDGKPGGPYSLRDLKILVENLKDVIDLKGRFVYTEEYDAEGNRTV